MQHHELSIFGDDLQKLKELDHYLSSSSVPSSLQSTHLDGKLCLVFHMIYSQSFKLKVQGLSRWKSCIIRTSHQDLDFIRHNFVAVMRTNSILNQALQSGCVLLLIGPFRSTKKSNHKYYEKSCQQLFGKKHAQGLVLLVAIYISQAASSGGRAKQMS